MSPHYRQHHFRRHPATIKFLKGRRRLLQQRHRRQLRAPLRRAITAATTRVVRRQSTCRTNMMETQEVGELAPARGNDKS